MSKSKVFMIIGFIAAVGASSAFSSEKSGGKDGPVHTARSVSLEEFRDRCLNPGKYDVQRAPENIRVQCTDDHVEYVAGQPGYVPLQGGRRVFTQVLSDKFVVAGLETRDVPVFAQSGSCFRFKEIEKTLTIERQLSCDEIVAMKGGLEDFCVSVLDTAKGKSPKLIEVRDTGRVVDTCAGLAPAGDGKGGDISRK